MGILITQHREFGPTYENKATERVETSLGFCRVVQQIHLY